MEGERAGSKPTMDQPHERLLVLRRKRDLDERGLGWGCKQLGFPAPGEHKAARGINLKELSTHHRTASGVYATHTARSRVQRRVGPHPLDHLGRIGEELKDGLRTRGDAGLVLQDPLSFA